MRRGILHIGSEKTGSTSLQIALARNPTLLRAHGFAYPTQQSEAHHRLVDCYVDPHLSLIPMSGPEKEAYLGVLAKDIEVLPAEATIIFSSEFCHSRLNTVEAASRLVDGIAKFGVSLETIVVYLRDQCSLLESSYSEMVKAGRIGTPDELLQEQRGYYSHEQLVNRWTTVAARTPSKPKLKVCSYVSHRHQLITHFLSEVGFPAPELLKSNEKWNARASRAVLEAVQLGKAIDPSISAPEFHDYLKEIDPRRPLPFLSSDLRRRVVQEFANENWEMCEQHGLDPMEFPACLRAPTIDDQPLAMVDAVRFLIETYQRAKGRS